MKTHAKRNGADWVLSGSKMWITNGGIADIAVVWASTDDGIRGFLVPRGARGFTTRNIHKKMSLRASVTSELYFDDVKLPGSAVLPGVHGLKGPLSCLSEARFGILWGVTGAARTCFEVGCRVRQDARAVRPEDRRLPAHPAQARLDAGRPPARAAARAAPGPPEGGRARSRQSRSASAR